MPPLLYVYNEWMLSASQRALLLVDKAILAASNIQMSLFLNKKNFFWYVLKKKKLLIRLCDNRHYFSL